jgi:sucrose-6-phosphate hydrolase SacC (GH32 family)
MANVPSLAGFSLGWICHPARLCCSDGREFTPDEKPQRLPNGNCWYAAQVFSDIPAQDGRCILIPWGRLPDGEIFRA